MSYLIRGWVAVFSLVGFAASSFCLAESAEVQLRVKESDRLQIQKKLNKQLSVKEVGQISQNAPQRISYLDEYFQLMDKKGADIDLQRSFERVQQVSTVLEDAASLYQSLTIHSKEQNRFYGEARWRALYLLGELRDSRAKELFFTIASKPMPNPNEAGEVRYKTEYRMLARAIAGLEKLSEVELLERIYQRGGVAKGLAAASLYELGSPPAGVYRVNALDRLGYVDPEDYNPGESRIRRRGWPFQFSTSQSNDAADVTVTRSKPQFTPPGSSNVQGVAQ